MMKGEKMNLEEVKKDLKQILSEKRYTHSCRNNEYGERTCKSVWRK